MQVMNNNNNNKKKKKSSKTSFHFWGDIEYQLEFRFWGILNISWDIKWGRISNFNLGGWGNSGIFPAGGEVKFARPVTPSGGGN